MKISLLFLCLSTLVLSGCESPQNDPAAPASAGVSAIPWNKPASWEGSGALGGFMPQGGH